jgi:histidinol dehydrogenase
MRTSLTQGRRGAEKLAEHSSCESFLRLSPRICVSAALRRLAPSIATQARAEGLEAHARSVEVRL